MTGLILPSLGSRCSSTVKREKISENKQKYPQFVPQPGEKNRADPIDFCLFRRPEVTKPIDIESLQNRLLKVCYVPATSTGLNRHLLFSFFAAAVNSTNEANKAGGTRC
jgi:hypothetical protein